MLVTVLYAERLHVFMNFAVLIKSDGEKKNRFFVRPFPDNFILLFSLYMGRVAPVGIATDYGLDGPGSNPGGDENFRSFRPALGPTQLL